MGVYIKKKYKRKRGRKKHRGRKKGGRDLYRIILVNHGRILKVLTRQGTEMGCYKKFKQYLKESDNVTFPVKYNNEREFLTYASYELVMLKRNVDNENPVTRVMDSQGEFVDYQTTDSEWLIHDRADYNVEESFWVYGYHPSSQRKSFPWIVDNLIAIDMKDKYAFKNIVLYHNKLLIESGTKLEMVICKNLSDAIRMYNMIDEIVVKNKMRYVVMMGNVAKSKNRSFWFDKISNLTHWSRHKINQTNTSGNKFQIVD